jgi:hypothetical protein
MSGTFLVLYLLAFMFVCAATLYWSRIHLLKFAVIAMIAFIASAIYFSFENYKGWASQANWPSGQVVAVEIRTPDETVNDKGAIYVWMYLDKRPERDWFVYVPTFREPRVYELPYTSGSEKEWTNAKQALKKGMLVYLQGKGQSTEGKNGNPGKEGAQKEFGDALNYQAAPHPQLVAPEDIITKGP